jgi:hypothetical protein
MVREDLVSANPDARLDFFKKLERYGKIVRIYAKRKNPRKYQVKNTPKLAQARPKIQ